MPLNTHKIVKSGKYTEVYTYERPQAYGFSVDRQVKRGVRKAESKRADNVLRSKRSLVRRIMANSTRVKPIFVTLTYQSNQDDREQVVQDIRQWLRGLREYRDVEYLYVLERQERGAYHVHMLVFNHSFINIELMRQIWQDVIDEDARVNVKRTNDMVHIANYLGKYLGKDFAAGNKRAFSCSRGLISSEEMRFYRTYFNYYSKGSCIYSGGYFMDDGTFVKCDIYYET